MCTGSLMDNRISIIAAFLLTATTGTLSHAEERFHGANDLVPFFENHPDTDPRNFDEDFLLVADLLFERAFAQAEERRANFAARYITPFIASPSQGTLGAVLDIFSRLGIGLSETELDLVQGFAEREEARVLAENTMIEGNIQALEEQIARIGAENAERRSRIAELEARIAEIRAETAEIRAELKLSGGQSHVVKKPSRFSKTSDFSFSPTSASWGNPQFCHGKP